jgi:hypothetical protein
MAAFIADGEGVAPGDVAGQDHEHVEHAHGERQSAHDEQPAARR